MSFSCSNYCFAFWYLSRDTRERCLLLTMGGKRRQRRKDSDGSNKVKLITRAEVLRYCDKHGITILTDSKTSSQTLYKNMATDAQLSGFKQSKETSPSKSLDGYRLHNKMAKCCAATMTDRYSNTVPVKRRQGQQCHIRNLSSFPWLVKTAHPENFISAEIF
ncbi:unnamed protein product [Natator depressus]